MPPEAPATQATTPPPSTPSTPAATPSPSEPAAPAVPADERGVISSVDWAAESSDTDEPVEVVNLVPEAPAQPAAPQEQPTTPAASPASVTTPAPKAEPPAATPPAAEAPAAPVVEQLAPKSRTPEQEAADNAAAAELLTRYTGELETFYALPEDLASQMQTEPEVALPKLAAKLHMAVENAVMQRIRQEVPNILQHVHQVRERDEKAKAAFYKVNDDLVNYEEQVLKIGQFFRAANPNATQEQAIQRIGEMTRLALGLPARTATAPAAAPNTPPAAPPARTAPFRPAQPGAAGPAAAPSQSGNVFTQIAEELLEEDQG